MKFPSLYKKSVKNKIQIWEIETQDSHIKRKYGFKDGKMRDMTDIIVTIKNRGKSNETTLEQQAIQEAQSLWQAKKEHEGYTEDINDISNIQTYKPMLANDYNKFKGVLRLPLFIQPKLDGIRALAYWKDGQVVLMSRKYSIYPFLQRIKAELYNVLKNHTDIVLDGELYFHGYECNQIAGIVNTTTQPHPQEDMIQFVIFDMFIPGQSFNFSERYKWLVDNIHCKYEYIYYIDTRYIQDINELQKIHEYYLNEHYEGSIIRQDAPYEQKRSNHLLKYKDFQDAEYKIIDVIQGNGKDMGCAIHICMTETGQTFQCRMAATVEERQNMFKHKGNFIGKMLVVKYQELTEYGIPRFPVGIRIREGMD